MRAHLLRGGGGHEVQKVHRAAAWERGVGEGDAAAARHALGRAFAGRRHREVPDGELRSHLRGRSGHGRSGAGTGILTPGPMREKKAPPSPQSKAGHAVVRSAPTWSALALILQPQPPATLQSCSAERQWKRREVGRKKRQAGPAVLETAEAGPHTLEPPKPRVPQGRSCTLQPPPLHVEQAAESCNSVQGMA